MKTCWRQAARDDVIRQFRYYLVTAEAPEVALRFRNAVKLTVASLRDHAYIGPRHILRNPQLRDLRSWPVSGFDNLRIYYIPDLGTLHVIRVLHQKRNVRRILESKD